MRKGTSFLISSNLKPEIQIQKIQRSDLWFRTYQYMVKMPVSESNALRRMDHTHIDRVIAARRNFGRRLKSAPLGSWVNVWEPIKISEEEVDNLHSLCDFFSALQHPYRLTIGWNKLYFYTNDVGSINGLLDLPFLSWISTVYTIDLRGQPNSITLANSDHGFRTYLKFTRLSESTARSLKSFLLAQGDLRLSPTLSKWCHSHKNTIYEYYFIDHDDPGALAMISLIQPGLTRKTLPILIDK